MSDKIKLYKKILNVMSKAPSLEKDANVGTGRNSYKAVSEKQVLNAIKPLLIEEKIIVLPIEGEIKEVTEPYTVTDDNGNMSQKIKTFTP